MSGLGMLASAIAGGSAAVGQQAAGDIEQGRKIDLATEQANIEAQMRMRVAEAQERIRVGGVKSDFAFANDPTNVAARQATKKSDMLSDGEGVRAATVAAIGDAPYQAAVKKQADTDATDAAARTRAATTAAAADPAFIKANWDVSMSDPRIKAAYAASMTSAGASGVQTKVLGEQFNQLVQTGSVATKVRGLQSELSQATNQTARDAIQQKISDLGFAGKDPSKFLALAEQAQDNIAAAMKIAMDPMATAEDKAAAKVQIQRATELSIKAAAMGGIKLETPPHGEPPAAAIEYLKKNPASADSFDAYYGKGLAAKALSPVAALPPAKKAASGMLALPGTDRTPDSPEAAALDSARRAEAAANDKLRSFGSVQQQRDPTGYRQAVTAQAAARDARLQADAAYKATIPGSGAGASLRYAAP